MLNNSIYHYTSASALINIIENNELWMTDRDFMNDINDRAFAYKVLNEVTEETKSVKIDRTKDFLSYDPQYVFSTSKEYDLIHQWIYYGKNDGYCIELNRGKLEALFEDYCDKNGIIYLSGDVIYDELLIKKKGLKKYINITHLFRLH